jgi:hypothetical protein
MAGMDSDQKEGSCNAAGMHFLQFRADYGCGDERNLGGHRYYDENRGPSGWRGWTVNR